MPLHQLLSHVAQELALPDLRLNSHGVCQFTVDDGITVTIEDVPLDRCAQIYSTIAHAPESQRESLFATLLEAQLFGREIGDGLAFGFEQSTGEILLCRKLGIDRIEAEAFTEALNEFIAWAEHWQRKLAQFNSTAATDATTALPEHFIRA